MEENPQDFIEENPQDLNQKLRMYFLFGTFLEIGILFLLYIWEWGAKLFFNDICESIFCNIRTYIDIYLYIAIILTTFIYICLSYTNIKEFLLQWLRGSMSMKIIFGVLILEIAVILICLMTPWTKQCTTIDYSWLHPFWLDSCENLICKVCLSMNYSPPCRLYYVFSWIFLFTSIVYIFLQKPGQRIFTFFGIFGIFGIITFILFLVYIVAAIMGFL